MFTDRGVLGISEGASGSVAETRDVEFVSAKTLLSCRGGVLEAERAECWADHLPDQIVTLHGCRGGTREWKGGRQGGIGGDRGIYLLFYICWALNFILASFKTESKWWIRRFR